VDQEQKRQKKGGEAAKGTEMLGDLKVCFLRSKLEMVMAYEINKLYDDIIFIELYIYIYVMYDICNDV
jgi:hypothetical protein